MEKIVTWNRTIHIMENWYGGDEQEAYIGKETVKGKDRWVNVIWIKDGGVAKRFLSHYFDYKEETIYMECLMVEERFYVLFPYEKGEGLYGWLGREDCNLRKRLTIGKSLLNRLILYPLPDYLQWDGLAEEGVLVSDSLDVSFLHRLKNVNRFEFYRAKDVFLELERTFGALFYRELKNEASDSLSEFMDSLRGGVEAGYTPLYKQFDQAFQELWDMELEYRIKPKSLPFRIWKRVKAVLYKSRKLLAAILLILAVTYSVRTVFFPKPSKTKPDEAYRFSFIGGVPIETDRDVY